MSATGIIAASRLRALPLPMIFTVKSDNTGSSASNQFTIPTRSSFNYNYTVKVPSQGIDVSGITGDYTITFPSGIGTYDVEIYGLFPAFNHLFTIDIRKIIEIKQFGIYNTGHPIGTINTQPFAFRNAINILISATDLNVLNDFTYFDHTFLDSDIIFPEGVTFENVLGELRCFQNGSNEPLPSSLTFEKLTSGREFFTNNNIVSLPSSVILENIKNALLMFSGCPLQNVGLNIFTNCLCTNFQGAFNSTNLTQSSIDTILVNINSNGTSNGTFSQSGGSAPSVTGQNAITAMRSRGWTVTVTGGF